MLLRVWKVSLAPGKAAALEAFANTVSLPMFRRQAGCLAVFFTKSEQVCATVTVWSSQHAIDAMERSDLYRDVVGQIGASGILGDDHVTDVYSVYGGFVDTGLAELLLKVPH